MTVNLVVELPTRETPGFLRRSKAAFAFQVKLRASQVDASVLDEMVEFLLPFVKEPTDRDEARSALWDASQEQFEKIMNALTGGSATQSPPQSTTPSSPTT